MSVPVTQPKNLICNFHAPNLEQYQRWKVYVQWAIDNCIDVCHLTLNLTDAFMQGNEAAALVHSGRQVINIQQNDVFQYQVQKPRCEPYSLDCG
jgi:spore coat protein CotF